MCLMLLLLLRWSVTRPTTQGSLPLRVHGGGLPGGTINIEGKVSSQYVSSLLLSAPYAQAPLEIIIAEVSAAFVGSLYVYCL